MAVLPGRRAKSARGACVHGYSHGQVPLNHCEPLITELYWTGRYRFVGARPLPGGPACECTSPDLRPVDPAAVHSRWLAQPRIAQRIRDHCGVSPLRSHRLACGWTLEEAVAKLRMIYAAQWGNEPGLSHQRLSQWEIGADIPSARYLDALCQLYASRPDRLGFGRDYTAGRAETAQPTAMADPADASTGPRDNDQSCPPHVQAWVPERTAWSPVRGPDGALPADLLLGLKNARADANALLEAQSVSAATVDWWERIAEDYGRRQLIDPLRMFLTAALDDFAQLNSILNRRQPLEFQHRLYRVLAQMAGLIGFGLMGSGELRESHGWYHTARLAADETGDRQLRAWVATCEAMAYFWEPDLIGRSASHCEEARAMAGSTPSPAAALANSVQARVCAKLGRRREALDAIQRAEAIFDRLSPAQTVPNRLGFYEVRLQYDQENALTRIGEFKAAMGVQERALSVDHGESFIEPRQVKLDQASCLISLNEIDEGCSVAQHVLLGMPRSRRCGVILPRTRELESLAGQHSENPIAAGALHQIAMGA